MVVCVDSINFGKKGYGNFIQLAQLQSDVANQLNVPAGPLLMIVKSATICKTAVSLMSDVIAAAKRAETKVTSGGGEVV